MKDKDNENILWLFMVSGSVFSCLIGYIGVLQRKISRFLNGGWLGFIVGLMMYNLGLYNYHQIGDSLFFYLVTFSLAIIMGLLSLVTENFEVFSSGLVGSYFVIRGLSLFIGFYPNEFEVAYLVDYQQNLYESLIIYYPYCTAILILFISGSYMQIKHSKHKFTNQPSLFS